MNEIRQDNLEEMGVEALLSLAVSMTGAIERTLRTLPVRAWDAGRVLNAARAKSATSAEFDGRLEDLGLARSTAYRWMRLASGCERSAVEGMSSIQTAMDRLLPKPESKSGKDKAKRARTAEGERYRTMLGKSEARAEQAEARAAEAEKAFEAKVAESEARFEAERARAEEAERARDEEAGKAGSRAELRKEVDARDDQIDALENRIRALNGRGEDRERLERRIEELEDEVKQLRLELDHANANLAAKTSECLDLEDALLELSRGQ